MDRSIIVLMKSIKITFYVRKLKVFFWRVVSRTGEFFNTFPRTEIKYTQKNQETAPKTLF